MSLSIAARDLLTTLMIGSSLLWEMMLWLSVSNFKNKAALFLFLSRPRSEGWPLRTIYTTIIARFRRILFGFVRFRSVSFGFVEKGNPLNGD